MAKDFAQLGIRRELIEALKKSGIKEPTPVQEESIPLQLSGKDVMVQSQTGTGKTLAFLLPILEKINPAKPYLQALIITPTRELALQITNEANKLAKVVGCNVVSAYGGADLEKQITKLAGKTQVLVGTPGRLLDHLRRGTVNLGGVTSLVLDEADTMLHMGFLDEVEQIMGTVSPERRTMLFSATLPGPIRELARAFMRNSMVLVEIKTKQITLDAIEQISVLCEEETKLEALVKQLKANPPYLALVFCRTKLRAAEVGAELAVRGFNADELHGDMSQNKREQVLKRFRSAELQILVCTDLAARGLDVEGVTHVFNYDMPENAEWYVHRIGRTGRAGESGVAVTFFTPRQQHALRQLEANIRQKLEKGEPFAEPSPTQGHRVARAKPMTARTPGARMYGAGVPKGAATAPATPGRGRNSVRTARTAVAKQGGGRRGGSR